MTASTNPITAWLFPGQGSQEVGMGGRLLRGHVQAQSIISLATSYSGLPLLDVMRRGPESTLQLSEYVQPAIVSISCAYIDLLRDNGQQPQWVAGHSLGELSAMYAASVISLQDTLRLAVERGRLMSMGAVGGMLAVKNLTPEIVEQLVEENHEGSACLANYNAPSQLVISGDEAGLTAMTALVRNAGGDVVRLNVSGAWHSPLVAVAAYEFQKILETVVFKDPVVPIVMASTATAMHRGEDIKAIMMRQMTSPVRWFTVIDQLIDSGCRNFLEVGPGKVLKGLMRRIIPNAVGYQMQCVDQGSTAEALIKHAQIKQTQVQSVQGATDQQAKLA